MEDINVFISFDIIKNSNPQNLYKELDLLILAKKKIHLWSKAISPEDMAKYCKGFTITPEDYNAEQHQIAWNLRNKEKLSYQDISKKLDINLGLVGFYVRTKPGISWKISDWIEGYHPKDSSVYEKIDYLVDNDKKLVEKFIKAGRKANYIERL
jgi:hypothetical protein